MDGWAREWMGEAWWLDWKGGECPLLLGLLWLAWLSELGLVSLRWPATLVIHTKDALME
jgi:hypothetical protein